MLTQAERDRSTARCFDYDALAWALQATEIRKEAQGAMDTARATGIEDARMLYHAGAIARRILSGS